MQRPVFLALILIGAVACGKAKETPPPPPALSDVLPRIPLPPDAQPLTTQSGADATQFIVVSPHPVDTVAAFYRKTLGEPPFRLVNETTTGGVVAFYAEQTGPSLWVTVQKNGETGSMIIIAGAGTDSSGIIKKGIKPELNLRKP